MGSSRKVGFNSWMLKAVFLRQVESVTVLSLRWNQEREEGIVMILGSIDMHFKLEAKLIYLMMGIDGGNMGKRLSRAASFQVTTGVQVLGAMSRSKSNAILKMKGLLWLPMKGCITIQLRGPLKTLRTSWDRSKLILLSKLCCNFFLNAWIAHRDYCKSELGMENK